MDKNTTMIVGAVAVLALVGFVMLGNSGGPTGYAAGGGANKGICVILPNTNAPETTTLGSGILSNAQGVCEVTEGGNTCTDCLTVCEPFNKINDKFGCTFCTSDLNPVITGGTESGQVSLGPTSLSFTFNGLDPSITYSILVDDGTGNIVPIATVPSGGSTRTFVFEETATGILPFAPFNIGDLSDLQGFPMKLALSSGVPVLSGSVCII